MLACLGLSLLYNVCDCLFVCICLNVHVMCVSMLYSSQNLIYYNNSLLRISDSNSVVYTSAGGLILYCIHVYTVYYIILYPCTVYYIYCIHALC